MEMNKLFSSETLPDLNILDKVKILGLTDQRIRYLKETFVEEYTINENDYVASKEVVIDSDKVVGTIRSIRENMSWYDFLDEKCHKDNTIRCYNKENFESVLLNPQIDGLPSVIEVDGEYYIAGNGLHRLTMAKCLGGKSAKVILKEKIVL